MGRYYTSKIGKGIGTEPQTSLENQEYENKVREIEENKQDKQIEDNNTTQLE